MRIDTLKIENFRSIKSLKLELGGKSAVISGQNGTGKSSVLDAVNWLIAAQAHAQYTPVDNPNAETVVEIVTTDGLELRREALGKSTFYINGVPCNALTFNKNLAPVFKGALPVLLTPFNFCNMHYSDRRKILMERFATDLKPDMADFAEIAPLLQSRTPDQIIKAASAKIRQYEKELLDVPARIDELKKAGTVNPKKVSVFDDTDDIDTLELELSKAMKEYEDTVALGKKSEGEAEGKHKKILQCENEILNLERQLNELRVQYRENAYELTVLREEYRKSNNTKCPTCGADLPEEKLAEWQYRKQELVETGKALAMRQELIIEGAEDLKSKISELQKEVEELKKSAPPVEPEVHWKERSLLQRISELKEKLAKSALLQKTSQRIAELMQREKKLGALKSDCDKKIYLAEKYAQCQMRLLEEEVNRHFEFGYFKMFQTYKLSGGLKEACDYHSRANNVPFQALSKGEQLKAAFDIVRALQGSYGVEFPIFIDDAESYTKNSLVNVPNQLILLKVEEGVASLTSRLLD